MKDAWILLRFGRKGSVKEFLLNNLRKYNIEMTKFVLPNTWKVNKITNSW